MKLLRQQNWGTEQASRCSIAGPLKGYVVQVPDQTRGLGLRPVKPVCSFSAPKGSEAKFLWRLDSKMHSTVVYLNRNARHTLKHFSLPNA